MKTKSTLMMAGVMAMSVGAACDAYAQTNVTIYGIVDAAIVYSSNQGGKSNIYERSGNLAGSRLGFRGNEDLGGGLSALFVLENGFNVDDGSLGAANTLFNRQSYVGLNSNAGGSLTVGRQYTPYYLFVGPVGPTSSLTGATGAHPGDIDGLDTTIRINNSLTYTSPVFGGAQVSAQYGFGETAGSTGTGNAFSVGLKYDINDFKFALGYLKLKNGANLSAGWSSTAAGSFSTSVINKGYLSAESVQFIAGGARYKIGQLELGVNASNVQYEPGLGSLFSNTATFNTGGVLATYQLTQALFVSGGYSYTKEKKANGITDPAKYQQLALEQTYSLSKRTALYALEAYQYAKGKTVGAAGGASQVNAVAVVGDSQNGTPSGGRNQTVLMAGIRHSF
ncbi:porin [Collimonas sp. OK607]|uniref:porin n=1 Tax=Collimonas sp. OK607 TaxID=1798194 RepID=UPI000B81C038|nr:porin [Collimonas sp. OK607]